MLILTICLKLEATTVRGKFKKKESKACMTLLFSW
jgi:hypothetical protein